MRARKTWIYCRRTANVGESLFRIVCSGMKESLSSVKEEEWVKKKQRTTHALSHTRRHGIEPNSSGQNETKVLNFDKGFSSAATKRFAVFGQMSSSIFFFRCCCCDLVSCTGGPPALTHPRRNEELTKYFVSDLWFWCSDRSFGPIFHFSRGWRCKNITDNEPPHIRSASVQMKEMASN